MKNHTIRSARPFRLLVVGLLTLASMATLPACDGGGIDVEHTCQEIAQCAADQEGAEVTGAMLDYCEDYLEDELDKLDSASQERVDEAYEACADKSSCAFMDCVSNFE